MPYAYLDLAGERVGLDALALTSGIFGDGPQIRVDDAAGHERYAERITRAAQRFFGFPFGDTKSSLWTGSTPLAADELEACLSRKRFGAYLDHRSGLLRLHYREIVLKFRAGVSRRHQDAFLRRNHLEVRRGDAYRRDVFVVHHPSRACLGCDIAEVAEQLGEQREIVEFATPNFVSEFERCATSAIPVPLDHQWCLKDIEARDAWALSQGAGVTIAIVDDGVDVRHPGLRDAIKRRPDPDDARDLFGRDFFPSGTFANEFDPTPKVVNAPTRTDGRDGNDFHGTACAGVAASRDPLALGVAPAARILPVKVFLGADLAPDEALTRAIVYAAKRADVVSCSWVGSGVHIESALAFAATTGRKGKGAVLVCAAGNLGQPIVQFPASDPHCISVGALTRNGNVAEESNTGASISVYAPSRGEGRAIFTTDYSAPGLGFNPAPDTGGLDSGLYHPGFGGTSAATAVVAGVAALVLGRNDTLTRDQVAAIIQSTAVDATGSGRRCVNALRAVQSVPFP